MNEHLIEVFVEEAMELLEGLEDHLLVLEGDPSNNNALNAAFRALHSIKGSAAMFGFEEVGNFAHKVETLLDLCRTHNIPIRPETADLILRSGDFLKGAIQTPGKPSAEQQATLTALIESATELLKTGVGAPPVLAAKRVPTEKTYLVRFTPAANTYQRGVRPERLIDEVRALGTTSVRCSCAAVPALRQLDAETCHLSWDIIVSTSQPETALRDVFLFEEGLSQIVIEKIDPTELVEDGRVKKLGEILGDKVDPRTIEQALQSQRHLGEILVDDFHAPAQQVEEALFKQEHVRAVEQSAREDFERKSLRVHRDKLDGLVNLVGELVTVQAQLSQAVKSIDDRHVQGITDYIKRLIGELRSTSMQLRMVPLDTLQPKFKRLVRDLCKTLSKDIDIEMEGGKTEIDKSVIDSLTDPLMHLIRNACDHGVEDAEQRRAKGKPERGRIVLSAVHAGSFVRLTIRDDGAGLNHERILARAVERGRATPDAVLTPEQIANFIFAPGFSTAAQISAVSGRGVGLDVVKTAIETLGGTVQIQSEKNKGSLFILDIPLTMAIIDGFLARTGRQMMIIPLASVHSCFERPRPTGTETMIVNDGEFLPYVSMRELFSIAGEPEEREEVIIVSLLDGKLALGFDQILGGFQTVIKSIGELAREMPGLSGSAILPDGGIALILDVSALALKVKSA